MDALKQCDKFNLLKSADMAGDADVGYLTDDAYMCRRTLSSALEMARGFNQPILITFCENLLQTYDEILPERNERFIGEEY